MSHPKTLRPILNPGCDQVRNLVTEARRLQDLTSRIRKLLPAEEAPHLRAATPTPNAMILWTDSTVWATRLRYAAPHLATAIRDTLQLNKPVTVQVRVLPEQGVREPELRRPAALSADAQDVIVACAEHTSDPQLRAAWQRLAKTTTKKQRN